MLMGCMILTFSTSCGNGEHDSNETNLEDSLNSIENVYDVTVKGDEINIYLNSDSLAEPCEERFNFENAKTIMQISSNKYLVELFVETEYKIILHRISKFMNYRQEFSSEYNSIDIPLIAKKNQQKLLIPQFDYVVTNFSCEEFGYMYVLLKTLREDSVFVTRDTLFSEIFYDCSMGESNSCIDVDKLRYVCGEFMTDTAATVYSELYMHLTELDSIRKRK